MEMEGEWSAALQSAVEEGEQGDWAAYALGHPQGRRKSDMRPVIAGLLAQAAVPSLNLRGAVFAIDGDPQVAAVSALVEARESRGEDPADLLVELFARRELLARQAGFAGYAQLALAADRVSEASVTAELAQAERMARRDAAVETADWTGPLPREAEVCDRFRSFFAPLLDGVEVRLEPDAAVFGMANVLGWPDRIFVVIRCADPAAPAAERVASLGTTAHELGHALQWRARAARGLGFLDFFSLTALEAETAAELGERLLFESELGRDMSLPRALWTKQRGLGMLRQVGRARFELRAYAAALDASPSLPTLWAAQTDASAQRGWSHEAYGFYTDDPMRRYTYPLAYLHTRDTPAQLASPLTAQSVTQVLCE